MIHVTRHKSGKLKGFLSISTSTLENDFCRRMPTEICKYCYARRLSSFRKNMEALLKKNSELLSRPLKDEELPVIPEGSIVRFNSFGELINEAHVDNLLRIVRANPASQFTLWTKRVDLVLDIQKPDNLILVLSEGTIDLNFNYSWVFKTYPIVDKIFVVDTVDWGQINCQKSCQSCMLCYSKNQVQVIHELLRR